MVTHSNTVARQSHGNHCIRNRVALLLGISIVTLGYVTTQLLQFHSNQYIVGMEPVLRCYGYHLYSSLVAIETVVRDMTVLF